MKGPLFMAAVFIGCIISVCIIGNSIEQKQELINKERYPENCFVVTSIKTNEDNSIRYILKNKDGRIECLEKNPNYAVVGEKIFLIPEHRIKELNDSLIYYKNLNANK